MRRPERFGALREIVARAGEDPAFKTRLIADPGSAFGEAGRSRPPCHSAARGPVAPSGEAKRTQGGAGTGHARSDPPRLPGPGDRRRGAGNAVERADEDRGGRYRSRRGRLEGCGRVPANRNDPA